MFANLLTNAAKYTPSGGSITVTAKKRETMLRVAVQDTGIGIAPRDAARVFDLFVQGARVWIDPQGGLGLGLSIVKALVTLHRGAVQAHSDGPGKGSEFVVRLAGDDDIDR